MYPPSTNQQQQQRPVVHKGRTAIHDLLLNTAATHRVDKVLLFQTCHGQNFIEVSFS